MGKTNQILGQSTEEKQAGGGKKLRNEPSCPRVYLLKNGPKKREKKKKMYGEPSIMPFILRNWVGERVIEIKNAADKMETLKIWEITEITGLARALNEQKSSPCWKAKYNNDSRKNGEVWAGLKIPKDFRGGRNVLQTASK